MEEDAVVRAKPASNYYIKIEASVMTEEKKQQVLEPRHSAGLDLRFHETGSTAGFEWQARFTAQL